MEQDSDMADEALTVDEEPPTTDTPAEAEGVEALAHSDGRRWQSLIGRILGEGRSRLVWLLAGVVIVGGTIFGVVLFILLARGADSRPSKESTSAALYITSTPRPTATHTPTPTHVPTPTPDVILQGIKALGELSTVEYNLKTVVEKEARQAGLVSIGNVEIWRPRLHFLLVAGGRVKAGVDFREMVRYEIVDDRVTVYLSAPRILDYSVDARSLKVYYLHTGFGLSEEFVIDTYNEAVVEAQDSLRNAALQSDILETAQANASALVQSLIMGLGFSDVEVKFLAPGGDETQPLEVPWELVPTPAPFSTATPEG